MRSTLFILTLLLISTAFLSACTFSNDSYTGTDGLLISFVKNSPPEQAYESSIVPFSILLENKGRFDLVDGPRATVSLSYEQYYVTLEQQNLFPLSIETLYGVSPSYTRGDYKYVQGAFSVNRIQGQREQPETRITASVCYPYQTSFSQEVCVDTNLYSGNQRTQVCIAKPISLSSQGAPIAVTRIEPQIIPVNNGQYYKPQFMLTIENVGSGTLLSPVTVHEFDQACSLQRLNRTEVNQVLVDVSLLGRQLECTPSMVKLIDDKGMTRCVMRDEDLISGSSDNYKSMLSVNISYVYLNAVTQTLKIERTGIVDDYVQPTNECQGKSDGSRCFNNNMVCRSGECVSKCVYCIDRPNDDLCSQHISPAFSCSCTQDECYARGMIDQGKCISNYFCPGDAYCCDASAKTLAYTIIMRNVDSDERFDNLGNSGTRTARITANETYAFAVSASGNGINSCTLAVMDRANTIYAEATFTAEQCTSAAETNTLTFTPEERRDYVLLFRVHLPTGVHEKRVTLETAP